MLLDGDRLLLLGFLVRFLLTELGNEKKNSDPLRVQICLPRADWIVRIHCFLCIRPRGRVNMVVLYAYSLLLSLAAAAAESLHA